MEKHVVTDWWTVQKVEGTYLNGYVDGFGVIFLIKSLDEEANTATAVCGSISSEDENKNLYTTFL